MKLGTKLSGLRSYAAGLLAFSLLFCSGALVSVAPTIVYGLANGPNNSPQVRLDPGRTGATVRGRILSIQGAPLRRAAVALVPVPGGVSSARPTGRTNSQGYFEIEAVPPGQYEVFILRAGYLPTVWGKNHPQDSGQGLMLDLKDGQLVENLSIAIARGGVLIGHIFDDRGQPIHGAKVVTYEPRYVGGRLSRFPVVGGSTTTDAAGEYRIINLHRGRYYLRAFSTDTWPRRGSGTVAYASIFYPAGAEAGALPIDVKPGQTINGLDFQLPTQRASTVSGVVARPNGEPVIGALVNLIVAPRGVGMLLSQGTIASSTTRAPNGDFNLEKVPAGEYLMTVSLGGQNVRRQYVNLTGADMTDLRLVRHEPGSAVGVLVGDDGRTLAIDLSRVKVTSVPSRDGELFGLPRGGDISPDGTFAVSELRGPNVFRLSGLPAGWSLRSVVLDGADVTDEAVEFGVSGRDITGLVMTVTQQVGILSGTVVDKADKPAVDAVVIAFADDERLWGPATRFTQVVRSDAAGTFSFPNLLPGTYRVVATQSIADGQWLNPEYLLGLTSRAARVSVAPRATSSAGRIRLP